jgi:integrase
LEFLGRAGVGQAEAEGLRWQDIDTKAGTVRLFRVKTRTAFQIPIFPKLRPLLERLYQANLGASPTDRVFKISNPKKALAAACTK